MTETKIDDVIISCRGIDLMVNNDWDGCEKLFLKYKDHSPLTHYCYSFVSYMVNKIRCFTVIYHLNRLSHQHLSLL